MKKNLLKTLGGIAIAGAMTLIGTPAMAAPATAYTCTGGLIPSGTYTNLTVAGPCAVAPNATIKVTGNVTVLPGSVLDAHSAPSTITVNGNVASGPGSLMMIGCQAPTHTGNSAHPCQDDPEGRSTIAVKGSITLNQPVAVMLNGLSVNGNITVSGGGSPIPWSIKNNEIRGNVTVTGSTTWWIGVLFNSIRGNVTLNDIVITDTDGELERTFVVRNEIRGNLSCSSMPEGVFGYGNTIRGRATGQCAGPDMTGPAPW